MENGDADQSGRKIVYAKGWQGGPKKAHNIGIIRSNMNQSVMLLQRMDAMGFFSKGRSDFTACPGFSQRYTRDSKYYSGQRLI